MSLNDPRPLAFSYLRMSTEAQLDGDSLRRQLEGSRAFAERQGFRLAEENELKDIGMSGFTGANVKDGELGRFLQIARTGQLKGSYLLIESLDRLSRQPPMVSFRLFSEILGAGVHIATITDGRIYRASETDLGDLLVSIVVMSRAHEESATKSRRLSEVWANKRRNAGAQKVTGVCPAWLKLSKDRGSFEVIPRHAELVQRIFEESLSGVGHFMTAKRLNQEKIAPIGGRRNSTSWQDSYIQKILESRAVLGEYQPHRMVDGKRQPDGDPLPDYFPRIISDDLFYRAQAARRNRRQPAAAGRKGANVSNLFSGLAKCGYCGSKLYFIDKGPGPKGGSYLLCNASFRGLECSAKAWRYPNFEASFLALVSDVRLGDLLGSSEKTSSIDAEITMLEGQRAAEAHRRDRLMQLLEATDRPLDTFQERLIEAERAVSELERQIEAKRRERAQLVASRDAFYESRDEIQSLLNRLKTKGSDESLLLRTRVADRVRAVVEKIEVFTDPLRPPVLVRPLEGLTETEQALQEMINEQAIHSQAPCFGVVFKDGMRYFVSPDPEDPLRFRNPDPSSASSAQMRWRRSTNKKTPPSLAEGRSLRRPADHEGGDSGGASRSGTVR